MNQDEKLKTDVQIERKILRGLTLVGDRDLRQQIQAADQEMARTGFFSQKAKIVSVNANAKIIQMRRVLAIAAAVALLLVAGWWFSNRTTEAADPGAAFAQYFKPEKTWVNEILANRTGAFAQTDTLKWALEQYESGNYDQAVAALDTFLVQHPANDTALFYLAMSHLNQSRYAKAVQVLQPMTETEGSVFQLDAKWYLGLCYLKVDDGLEKAKAQFTDLAGNVEFKDRQSAQGILRMLEK